MDDISEVFLVAPLPESFPFLQATTGCQCQITGLSAVQAWARTSPIGERDFLRECSLNRVLRAAYEGRPPVITHGLSERVDVSPSSSAQRGVHKQVNVCRRRLLVTVIEPRGRVHGPLVLFGMQKMDGDW